MSSCWLADECIPAAVVASLCAGGQEALYVAEVASSLSDADAVAAALLSGVATE